MPLTPAEIVHRIDYEPGGIERIASRGVKNAIVIVEPDTTWPQQYQELKKAINDALGDTVVAVAHAGSTSVPGLPAKNIIDIDLTVKDIHDEAAYVGPLEAAGFLFLFRERNWHNHRFFGKRPEPTAVNLHVWGPDCPEVERHRIFREWLVKTPADKERYAQIKREAAAHSHAAGEDMMQYNDRKDAVLLEILDNAFRDLGYIE